MPLRSLREIRSLQDPAKQFQVEFVISEFPALQLARLQQTTAGLLSGNTATVGSDTLRLRAQSFSYPGTKINQTELILGGYRRKLGTIQDRSGTFTCKVTEDQGGGVLNTIQSWCDLIHNPINGVRLPSITYVSTAQVILESAKKTQGLASAANFVWSGSDKQRRTIWLGGFYPIEYKVGEINPNSSEAINVEITFNYDYFSETTFSLSGAASTVAGAANRAVSAVRSIF